jgi:uroporphyrinogen III methyltransferase/synthase
MRSVTGRLADLEAVRRAAGLEAPGLVLIGESVRHRQPASWFEQRPLFGKRILVTRPRHQAEGMIRKLELLGAVPHVLPTLRIEPPSDFGPLDQALNQLPHGWDWLVFTSANGVKGFFERLLSRGQDARLLGAVKIATVGPKTAEALRTYHLHADLVPGETFSSEGLVSVLKDQVAGQRVLLARANRGRELLREELARVADVEQVITYEQVDCVDASSEAFNALRRGEIEYITLTSSNIARGLLSSFDETLRGRVQREEIKLISLSPETSKAITASGLRIAGEAPEATTEGLIETMIRLVQESRTLDDLA